MNRNKNTLLNQIFNKRTFLKAGIYFIVLILFIFIMDSIIMPVYTKHGDSFELVDVTDKQFDEAVEMLESEGLEPVIQDSVFDEQFPPGAIIQQNPLPFTQVKDGRRVYLVVSIGEKPRYVPRLIGLTPQDAEFRLKEENLHLNQVFYEFSEFYHRGVVMNQSVLPGETVEKNQKINITVSLGPPPTSMEIPNLVGKSLKSAEKELEAVGVKLGKTKYVFRENLVPGTILNQSVSAGQKATKIDSVNLIISTDEPIKSETEDDTTTQ